jgi:hypothetical protein
MEFAIRNLSVLAYAQGFTLWHYKANAGTLKDTSAPGYFDDAADMLAVGDMVLVCARDGGKILVVSAMSGEVMTAPLA